MSIFCQSGAIPRSIIPFNDNFPISQSWPIHANRPIQCQSANLEPIRCQSANPRPIGQSQANPMSLLRTIPALNLGTSPLYGMVPSLLGGRNVRNSTIVFFLLIQANPVLIRCQSDVSFLVQHQFSNFPKPVYLSQSWPIECQS